MIAGDTTEYEARAAIQDMSLAAYRSLAAPDPPGRSRAGPLGPAVVLAIILATWEAAAAFDPQRPSRGPVRSCTGGRR